jgi:hypothetical protein
MLSTVNTENKVNTYVIKLEMRPCLLPSDFTTILNILFARRLSDKDCSLRRLINTLAIGTRVKRSFKDSKDPTDDTNEEILVFFKFDQYELPGFKSELISVYEDKLDKREFKILNKSKYLYLIDVPIIRLLQPSEQAYLKRQIDDYLQRKKELGGIELCKH